MLPIVLWGCLMKTLWPLNEIVESFPFIVYHQEAALRFGSCLHEHKLARSEVWFQVISWQSAFETSINPYYHIKYLLVCDVCFYTCKHSYWQINKVCKKQRQKKNNSKEIRPQTRHHYISKQMRIWALWFEDGCPFSCRGPCSCCL